MTRKPSRVHRNGAEPKQACTPTNTHQGTEFKQPLNRTSDQCSEAWRVHDTAVCWQLSNMLPKCPWGVGVRRKMEGRKEERREGKTCRKEGRKGEKECRKEEGKEGRKEGRKDVQEGRKGGRMKVLEGEKEGRREVIQEEKKKGRNEKGRMEGKLKEKQWKEKGKKKERNMQRYKWLTEILSSDSTYFHDYSHKFSPPLSCKSQC